MVSAEGWGLREWMLGARMLWVFRWRIGGFSYSSSASLFLRSSFSLSFLAAHLLLARRCAVRRFLGFPLNTTVGQASLDSPSLAPEASSGNGLVLSPPWSSLTGAPLTNGGKAWVRHAVIC